MTPKMPILGINAYHGDSSAALAGACLGLAAWLLARALFGGRRQR